MDKKERSIFFKLLTLGSVGFLSACTLFLGTYAWFAANNVVSGTGMSVVLKKTEIIEDVIFHKFSSVNNVAGEYHFELGGSSDFDFGKYSLQAGQQQSLIEIRLKDTMDVQIEGITSATFYLGDGAKDENGNLLHGLQVEGNSLTSIVSFYSYASSNVTFGSEYISIPKNVSTSGKKSFVNSDYTDLISDERLNIDTQNNATTLFLVVDYDSLSISTIYGANLGNNVFEDNTIFYFDIDFVFDVSLA